MNSDDIIELFYNRTYEKLVNKQILDDKNNIVPRQQIMSYVHEIINIPFIDYINFIKRRGIERIVKPSEITQFSSFPSCEIEMCKALIGANNPGCQYVDIGRFFPDKIISRNESAYKRYGESHIKAAMQLGLTFEYHGYWYLSCLGYIYPDMEKETRTRLLARTITRNRLYQQLLIEILDHDIKPEGYMNILAQSVMKRRLKSVCFFFDICLAVCKEEHIKTYSLIKTYNLHTKTSSLPLPIRTNIYLSSYLENFDYQTLSRETTIELIKRYRKGDCKAYTILVKGYMRLVLSVADNYVHKGIDYEDLIQEGVIGLIKSFDHYNENFTGGFSKYAQWWIRQAITEALVTQPLIVKIPLNVFILHRKVWRFIKKFEQENDYPPSIDDIELDNYADTHNIKLVSVFPENLRDLTICTDEWDEWDSKEPSPDDILMRQSLSYNVYSLLRKLNDRKAQIIQMVYGIGYKEETLSSISDHLGYTRERIRQIKEEAIKELQDIVETLKVPKMETKHIKEKAIKEPRDIVETSKVPKMETKLQYHIIKEAMVGDRIIYDSIRCTVIKKRITRGSFVLVVRYDDGSFANLRNDWNRYRVID